MVGTRASAEAEILLWMNDWKKHFGLQTLCSSRNFFQTPWSEQGIAYIAATEKRIDQMMNW